MRKIILILLLPLVTFAQGNVVPNGSFENCDVIPPIGLQQIGDQFAPYNVDVYGWFNPNTASPDYYNALNNAFFYTYNIPDESSFVGFSSYAMQENLVGYPEYFNAREYVSCTLTDILEASTYYFVSFYARLAPHMSYCASNNIGVHFSDTVMHSDD